MALNSNDSATGYEDCIKNNIPSRAFRYATESKNVLNAAGAMYVGTGQTRETTMQLNSSTEVEYSSYITNVLKPPTGNGQYVLSCKVTNGVLESFGWVKVTNPGTNNSNIAQTYTTTPTTPGN